MRSLPVWKEFSAHESAPPDLSGALLRDFFPTPAMMTGTPAKALRGAMAFNADLTSMAVRCNPFLAGTPAGKWIDALAEVTKLFSEEPPRPEFGIDSVVVDGKTVGVELMTLAARPFANLLHFKRDALRIDPKVLIIPPMSGHFGTLLRDTVRTMLPDHDVHMLSWNNPRDIPVSEGVFNLSSYFHEVMGALRRLGGDTHVVSVCQPVVVTLATVATLAEDGDLGVPRSMTLIAGPVDTRINPNKLNELAKSKSLEWMASNVFSPVESCYAGAGRRVLPEMLQLTNFMAPNLERHRKAFFDLAGHIAAGRTEQAQKARDFYLEYLAIMPLHAEYIMETVHHVFQQHSLPQGAFTYTDVNGQVRRPDLGAIDRTPLLTVEGGKDDICSVGQTLAAHEICHSIPRALKGHHLEADVGHYGTFSGDKGWRHGIYPIVKNHILTAESWATLHFH